MTKKAYLNIRIINPALSRDFVGGIIFNDKEILDMGEHVHKDVIDSQTEIIETEADEIIIPGLVDFRVHVGEPGREYKEDFDTACQAAVKGGITHMAVLPDCKPVRDTIAQTELVHKRSDEIGLTKLHPYSALTKDFDGQTLCEIGLLSQRGVVGFTDCHNSIQTAGLLARSFKYAKHFNALILNTPNDKSLSGSGLINNGSLSTKLGLKGISKDAEIIQLERDIRLLRSSNGARYHACNITTAESVDLIRNAKAEGLNITCDTAAFYISMNENDIDDYRTFTKLMPPLRHEDDRLALIEGFKDGTIDVLTSDHRAEDVESKRQPYEEASFGDIGLETLFSLAIGMMDEGELDLSKTIATITSAPASILGIDKKGAGKIEVGKPANFVRMSPTLGWKVDASLLRSKSKNTPYDGKPMTGTIIETIIDGKSVYNRNEETTLNAPNYLKAVG